MPVRSVVISLAFTALLVLVALLAVFSFDSDELTDPEISMRIEETWTGRSDGEELVSVEGKEWHVAAVNITNLNEEAEVDISLPHFYAETHEGEEIWVFNAEDYDHDPIPPGESLTLELIFLTDTDSNILKISYHRKLSGPVECDYGVIFSGTSC